MPLEAIRPTALAPLVPLLSRTTRTTADTESASERHNLEEVPQGRKFANHNNRNNKSFHLFKVLLFHSIHEYRHLVYYTITDNEIWITYTKLNIHSWGWPWSPHIPSTCNTRRLYRSSQLDCNRPIATLGRILGSFPSVDEGHQGHIARCSSSCRWTSTIQLASSGSLSASRNRCILGTHSVPILQILVLSLLWKSVLLNFHRIPHSSSNELPDHRDCRLGIVRWAEEQFCHTDLFCHLQRLPCTK